MVRTTTYSFVLVVVAAIGFVAGTWHAPREAVSAAAVEARRPLYYHCPMHPAFRSETPGTAPCCGMAYEPVYAGGADAATDTPAKRTSSHLAVTPQQQQMIGVRIGIVEEASGTVRLRLFGRVVPDETRLFRVNVGMDGYVREISRAATGSHVRKGQWLASFSTPEARQPIGAYLQALDVLDREVKAGTTGPQLAAATANLALAVDRLLTAGMSPVQIEEIRHTRTSPVTVQIAAPADGFVLTRNISAGEKFERDRELYRIADLRRVWILASVPAGDVDEIRPGTSVDVTIPGRSVAIRARVSTEVLPQFDAETQSVNIRIDAENPDFVLRPDMFVDVSLDVPYPPALVVPAEAVIATGLRNTVFVQVEPGQFEPREVEIGRRLDTRVAIRRGLEPGERIAISGTFLLDSESRMRGLAGR